MEGGLIELGPESKVVEVSLCSVMFEFGEGHQTGKDVVALSEGQFGGRLSQSRTAFERLVIFFDFPPFVVDFAELNARARQIART